MSLARFAPRFWARVQAVGECREWQGARHEKGYGLVRLLGRQWRAHRFSWELTRGSVPDGLLVCHRCDNPACVRIEHLFLGTPAVNSADMTTKRRGWNPVMRGESHARARLTAEQASEIRAAMANETATAAELARRFGVTESAISAIAEGRTWKCLDMGTRGERNF